MQVTRRPWRVTSISSCPAFRAHFFSRMGCLDQDITALHVSATQDVLRVYPATSASPPPPLGLCSLRRGNVFAAVCSDVETVSQETVSPLGAAGTRYGQNHYAKTCIVLCCIKVSRNLYY